MDAHRVSTHVIEREIRSQARSFLRRRLGEVLVESGAIDRRSLVDALAAQAHRGAVEVLSEPVDPVYLWKGPKELASSLRAIVLAGPRIAMADPLDARAIAMMRRLVGDDSAEVVAADDRDIAEAIERHYDMSWGSTRGAWTGWTPRSARRSSRPPARTSTPSPCCRACGRAARRPCRTS